MAIGALSTGVAVAAGAIGTHVLKESLKLPQSDLETYDVAVRYQMVHSLGLILVGMLLSQGPSRWLTLAASTFLFGIVLFSGGIYAWLATDNSTFIRVVPVGGSAWILGWLVMAYGVLRRPLPPRES
jgi:uncharacterized membrane protein YgdD (TMEM256/DUF423 family)